MADTIRPDTTNFDSSKSESSSSKFFADAWSGFANTFIAQKNIATQASNYAFGTQFEQSNYNAGPESSVGKFVGELSAMAVEFTAIGKIARSLKNPMPIEQAALAESNALLPKPVESLPNFMISGPDTALGNVASPAINRIVPTRRELLVQDFSHTVVSAMKNETTDPSLTGITKAVNDFRARNFPFVPEVIQTLKTDGYPVIASATRNEISWYGQFSRDMNGELRYQTSTGRVKPSSEIVGITGHEFVHLEQGATKIWRQADVLGIGAKASSSDMKALMNANAAEHKYDLDVARYYDHPGISQVGRPKFLTVQSIAEHVIKARDGRVLSPEFASRADRLFASYGTAPAIAADVLKAKIPSDKAFGFLKDFDPQKEKDLERFYVKVRNTPAQLLPEGMRSYVSKAFTDRWSSQAKLSNAAVGEIYFKDFEQHAKLLDAEGKAKFLGPYKQMLHESEAFRFQEAVDATVSSAFKS